MFQLFLKKHIFITMSCKILSQPLQILTKSLYYYPKRPPKWCISDSQSFPLQVYRNRHLAFGDCVTDKQPLPYRGRLQIRQCQTSIKYGPNTNLTSGRVSTGRQTGEGVQTNLWETVQPLCSRFRKTRDNITTDYFCVSSTLTPGDATVGSLQQDKADILPMKKASGRFTAQSLDSMAALPQSAMSTRKEWLLQRWPMVLWYKFTLPHYTFSTAQHLEFKNGHFYISSA